MERVRCAKIVATLGPATDGLEGDLVRAGLDVARLNFSHGTQQEHARRCAAVRAAAAGAGRVVAVIQDLQGPKIRVGPLIGGGPVHLERGRELAIECREEIVGTAERIGCTYPNLARDVQPGDRVLLDDGRIRLQVLASHDGEVRTRIEEGGPLGEHKGINLPGVAVSAPAVTDKDRSDLRFGVTDLQVDFVALSFVRSAAEVRAAQDVLRTLGRNVPCIVKLEKREAIEDLEAILQVADAVMVARGDLGVELAPEQVPMLQKRIIQRANQRGIPVITATQMLESMIEDETPTRAEASDVANAVWDGSDAVMLSAETATGRHPRLVLEMMDRIVRAAESADLGGQLGRAPDDRPRGYAAAVTHAARVLAEDLRASAIVGVTRTGLTAELLSRDRPRVPIFAFSPDPSVCARLALWWGVTPVHMRLADALEGNIAAMEEHMLRSYRAASADTVVITGSHPFEIGVHTNFVKYHVLGRAR
ncbi:MAG: pyruvate kinase [Chloroflexota bacterium]|nr:pyruvate kinase [Chloroflexota bacterium]